MSLILSAIFWLTQAVAIPFFLGLWPWLLNRWTADHTPTGKRWVCAACAFLAWVQVAQFVLVVREFDLLGGLAPLHIPGSFVLFPLNLAAMLGLYAVHRDRNEWLFVVIAGFMLVINAAIAAGTWAVRDQWFGDVGDLGSWSALSSPAATQKVVGGSLAFVLDLVVMVGVYKLGRAWAWRPSLTIAVPLLLALAVDAIVFAVVVNDADNRRDYFWLALGQLVSKFVTGLVYAGAIVVYLKLYHPGALGAPVAPTEPALVGDSPKQVFGRVRSGLWACVLAYLLSRSPPEPELPPADPTTIAVVLPEPESRAPLPDAEVVMDDPKPTGPNPLPDAELMALSAELLARPVDADAQASVRRSEAAFAAEYDALVADPALRGRWVAYYDGHRVGDGDTHEALFLRLAAEPEYDRHKLELYPVPVHPGPPVGPVPELETDAPPDAELMALSAELLARPVDADAQASVRRSEAAFAAEYDVLVADPALRGRWVAYHDGQRVATADASHENLFQRLAADPRYDRRKLELYLVSPYAAPKRSA